MLVYLAAPTSYRDAMPDIATQVEQAGHTITEKWWAANYDNAAVAIFEGVRVADCVVVLTGGLGDAAGVEQGIALAYDKPIIAVGTRVTDFHYMTNYMWVDNVTAMLTALDTAGWIARYGTAAKAKREQETQAG